MLNHTIKVAIADTFLDSMNALHKTPREATMRFMKKFRANPTLPGLNYETIENASDDNLRSVRVSKSVRAIVLKPETGNVYVLLWVAEHDDAYDWATRKRVTVHPSTGTLQVLPVEVGEGIVEPSEVEDDTPGLFDEFRDRELRRFGLPESMFETVRACRTLKEYKQLNDVLPAEAYEALYWLANGDSVEDVYAALMMDPSLEPEYDTHDIEGALERATSKRHFVMVEDDEALQNILDAPLEKWRTFLHPVQRKLVEGEVSGPSRVLGGAGTGKTVVAMHRAVWLIENVHTQPSDRVLFTTFTANLADDIRDNLRLLTTPDVMRKIEVKNIDRWVSEFLQKQGYDHQIRYFNSGPYLKNLWESAMASKPDDVDLPEGFYREEWERVIQDKGVQSLRDYFMVSRTGRGQGLHRAQRKKVWAVFEEYRKQLERAGLKESPDAMRDARHLLADKGDILPYRSIVVDEAQDLSSEAFKLIRQMIQPEQPNDIFIVGDAHQRIYGHRVVMKHCGIHIVGRAHRLRINYRTTDEIRARAVGILEGVEVDDLDGELDSVKGYMSLMFGEKPEFKNFQTQADEIDAIADWLGDKPERNKNTCLVARTHALVDDYARGLEKRGFETHRISRSAGDDRSKSGVRVATMHRVKGLEFDRVVVAGVNEGTMPLSAALRSQDEAVREAAETAERALLYVSLTRAKRAALVTSHGKPSPWI